MSTGRDVELDDLQPARERPRGWQQDAPRRRSPALVVLVAVAAAALGGWLASGGDGAGVPVEPRPEVPSPAPGNPDAKVDDADADGDRGDNPWKPLPHSPLVRRAGHSVTWTGEEVIIWGGSRPERAANRSTHLRSGAAYDPATDRWRRLAPAPIPPRDDHVAVWTGEEVLIWGGRAAARGPVGAAYDPAGRGWRELPSGPLDHHSSRGAGAWTGRELLVWAQEADRLHVAAYDPRRDEWRAGRALEVTAGTTVEAAWARDRLAVLAVTAGGSGSLHRYHLDRDTWGHLSGRVFPQPEGFAAVGSTLVLWGHLTGEQFGRTWAAAVDARSGALRELPGPSVRLARDHLAVSTGSRLLVWDGRRGSMLDLGRERWVTMPDAPIAPRGGPAGAWTGEELVVWGGGGAGYHADGARVRPPAALQRGGGPVLR